MMLYAAASTAVREMSWIRKNDDPTKIVCAFTVSNDSIRIYDLPRSRKFYKLVVILQPQMQKKQ